MTDLSPSISAVHTPELLLLLPQVPARGAVSPGTARGPLRPAWGTWYDTLEVTAASSPKSASDPPGCEQHEQGDVE
ncbi:unnamed protein product [Gadus morhua 'NCC']